MKRVQSALSKVPGVVSAVVSMPDKAVVKYEKGKVTNEQLIEAVKKAGSSYSAKVKS